MLDGLFRIVLVIALFGCWRSTPRPAPLVVSTPEVIAPPALGLDDKLAARSVTDDDFYRPILYTWTPVTSIAELRASHLLLVATTTSGGFVSPFNRALGLLGVTARPGAEIARLLRDDPQLARRRYAWPTPFATVLGIGARGYGNALIRIELRPEAWIGRFAPTDPQPFTFVDDHHHPIASADVLAHPERIGAIFHVRADPYVAVKFREFVVCNPAMVRAWSIATPEIRAEVAAERALVLEVAGIPRATSPAVTAWAASPATQIPSMTTTIDRWHATLAFDNARYRPQASALARVVAALDAYDPAGAALSVSP